MEYLKCVMKILLQRHIVPTCGMKLLKPSRIMWTALRQLSNGAGDEYDDVELPVTGNDNGSWTCNASKSSENMQNVMFSDDWSGFVASDYGARRAHGQFLKELEVF